MALRDLLKRFRQSDSSEDYMELDQSHEEPVVNQIGVRVENITNISDAERIQERLRAGNILLIKISELKNSDMEELKRTIAKIKRTVSALDGEIVGVGRDWLLATSGNAKIQKEVDN